MAISWYGLLSFWVFFTVYAADDVEIAITITAAPSAYTNVHVTKLVDEVCDRTSNYTFCINALNSDPRTPDADGYTLAYISFRLAYLNASKTLDQITQMLKNTSSSSKEHRNLQICQRDYKNGVQNLESALNDLNSETFFTLPGYANDTARVAEDCQTRYPPLNSIALKLLCEICFVVSKLFTESSHLMC